MIVMKNTLLHYVFILMFTLLFPQVDCSAGISEVGPVKPLVNKDENLLELTFREIIEKYYSDKFYLGIANHAKSLGQLSTEIADREFNYITPSNDFKQSYIHPTFTSWRWDNPDAYLLHAKEKGQLLRIHGPISPQCSKWVKEDKRTSKELVKMLEEYMTQLCVRYGNQPNVRWMDVVNETIAKENVNDPVFDPQKRGEWFAARQGTDKWENPWTIIGYDETSDIRTPLYIDMAFALSNKYAPGVKQIINQHGNFEEVVWEQMKKLVKYLRGKGRRVDGIGWQAHIDTGWEKTEGNVKRLDDFITWCHANNLEFHITEMNVWIKDLETTSEAQQAETFATVIETVLKHYKQGKVGVNFWNVRDEDTANSAWNGCIWRNDGTPRPAYNRIKEVLIRYIEKK